MPHTLWAVDPEAARNMLDSADEAARLGLKENHHALQDLRARRRPARAPRLPLALPELTQDRGRALAGTADAGSAPAVRWRPVVHSSRTTRVPACPGGAGECRRGRVPAPSRFASQHKKRAMLGWRSWTMGLQLEGTMGLDQELECARRAWASAGRAGEANLIGEAGNREHIPAGDAGCVRVVSCGRARSRQAGPTGSKGKALRVN